MAPGVDSARQHLALLGEAHADVVGKPRALRLTAFLGMLGFRRACRV